MRAGIGNQLASWTVVLLLAGCSDSSLAPSENTTDDDAVQDDDTSGLGDTDDGDDTGDDDSIADDDAGGDDDTGTDDDTMGDYDTDDVPDDVFCPKANVDIVVPVDYPSIQGAIGAASDGDVICVESGTYSEHIDFLGKAIHVYGVAGPHFTIIEGGGNGVLVQFVSSEGADSILEGFTLRNAELGVDMFYASPTLVNLFVTDNVDYYGPAGLYLYNASPTLTNLVVARNWAGYEGGGLDLADSSASLYNVLVADNYAGYEAGGLDMRDSTPTLTNVMFLGNFADYEGGGINMRRSNARMTNVVFVRNRTNGAGGAIKMRDSSPLLTNVVMLDNQASSSGGGIAADADSFPSLAHVDVWGNAPDDYCTSMTNPTGTDGNMSVDPQFIDLSAVDPLDWDVHLATTSPLVDAGDTNFYDLDASVSDIGAYGGPFAGDWDKDWDGYNEWWLPGLFDPLSSPGSDCDDRDPSIYPGNGC